MPSLPRRHEHLFRDGPTECGRLFPLVRSSLFEKQSRGRDGVVKPLFCLGEEKLMPKQSERTAAPRKEGTLRHSRSPSKSSHRSLSRWLAGCCRQARQMLPPLLRGWRYQAGFGGGHRRGVGVAEHFPRARGCREPFALGKLRGIVTRQRSNWLRERRKELSPFLLLSFLERCSGAGGLCSN